MDIFGVASPRVALFLKSSLKGFHFITKIIVLFDFMLLWILVLSIVATELIIGLVILGSKSEFSPWSKNTQKQKKQSYC